MKVEFKNSFARDLRKVKDKNIRRQLQELIEAVEQTESIRQLKNVKKLRGSDKYYRIRVGDYRLGIISQQELVVFVRFLHRREIYRYFP